MNRRVMYSLRQRTDFGNQAPIFLVPSGTPISGQPLSDSRVDNQNVSNRISCFILMKLPCSISPTSLGKKEITSLVIQITDS